MAAGVVSSTYGHALFELAVEENRIDELLLEAEVVKEVLSENPDYQKLLEHPRIDREEKVILLESCFRGRVSDDMTGLLCVMVRNDRQKEIISSLQDFADEVREYRGIGVCHVVSALLLTDDQKERLIERLIETTRYNSFEMHYETDPSLIGGLTVRIGDRVIDMSIRSKLNDLTKTLRQVSVEAQ